MANRITKGKALIGSLDVQGELTINGAPVGSGGGGDELVITFPPNYQLYFQQVGTGSGFSIATQFMPNNGLYNQDTQEVTYQGFITDNNIQEGDRFDWTYEYFSGGQWVSWAREYSIGANANFYANAYYDMMWYGTALRFTVIGAYLPWDYSISNLRITMKKKG